MIRREPCLGSRGFPGQKIYEGEKLLGTITRTGNYSFSWTAENGKWGTGIYNNFAYPLNTCIKPRDCGIESTSEEAERALIRVFGITTEEFE